MGIKASLPVYAVEDVPGKGKGVIATRDIPKGTRIISEKPFVTGSHQVTSMEELQIRIHEQVCSLNESQQREFLSMHNIYPYTNSIERCLGIFRTNALPIGTDLDNGGVFLNACRVNHACDNNAQNFWNENTNRLTIHAVRDIQEGEEITIYYLGSRRNRRARQEQLQKEFKFTCSCQLCSLPLDQRNDSDEKLDRIYKLDCIIELGGIPGLTSSPQRMLSYVDEQIRLWNEPTPDEVGLARAYPDAFQIAIANGDLARGRIFAKRLLSLYSTTLGDDSPDVIQYSELARNPSAHQYYGMSMVWKTSLDEVPQRLRPKELEDWLWKRDNRIAQGQLADLRDRLTFPSFSDLPDEREMESKYFEYGDGISPRPVCHWCFLAEVQDIESSVRPRMTIKDADGMIVPFSFHIVHRGKELAKFQIRPGYTVAILYAVRQASMFSESSIYYQNAQMIKVSFPKL